MPRPHRFESPVLNYAYRRYIRGHSDRETEFEQGVLNAEAAMAIYRMRTQAGLTQAALARRIGTTASVISRLEDADYDGHSLAMLRRISHALDWRVQLRFVPASAARPARKRRKRTSS